MSKYLLVFLAVFGLFGVESARALDCDISVKTTLSSDGNTFTCQCNVLPKSIHLGDLIDIHWGAIPVVDDNGNLYNERMSSNGYTLNYWTHKHERNKMCKEACIAPRSWQRHYANNTCNDYFYDLGTVPPSQRDEGDDYAYSGGGSESTSTSTSSNTYSGGWTDYDPYEGHNSGYVEIGEVEVVNGF